MSAAPVPAARIPRGEWLGLAAVLALAALLRWRAAVATPLWFDELFTLWMARHAPGEMLPLLAGDVHPPLFTLLVAGWRSIAGDAPMALKSLSIAIGLLAIATLHGFTRALFGPRAALLATALLAFHPMHIYFSQELRSYGLLTLALVLAAWAAWRWVETGRRRDLVAWVLAAALTVHTHYLGFVILGVLDVWVAWSLRRTPRRLVTWFAAHAGVLALLLPLAGMLPAQLELSKSSWVPAPKFSNVLNLVRKTCFGALYLIPPLAALGMVAVARPATHRGAILAAWMGAGSIGLTFGVSMAGGHLFAERYLYFTVPYACMLFAAGALGLPPRVAPAAAMLVLAFAARAAWLWHPLAEPVALRDVSAIVARNLQPGDVLFCVDTHSLLCVDHHLGGEHALLVVTGGPLPYYVGDALVPAARRVSPDRVREAAARGERWWAIRTREGGLPTGAIAALLDSLAAGPRLQREMVTLWAGRPGMFDTLSVPTSPAASP